MKTIYGHEVKDLSNARIVSREEAERLYDKAVELDRIGSKYNLTPIINKSTTI